MTQTRLERAPGNMLDMLHQEQRKEDLTDKMAKQGQICSKLATCHGGDGG